MKPKISIITACNNSFDTILYTINSIKSQSYKNIEHIIVDNQSNDGSLEILKKYQSASQYHSIKLIIQRDKGIYDAINKGILKATGKYICILNSDDIFQSNRTIENIIKKIKNERDTSIFFFNLIYFSKKNFSKIVRYYSSENFKNWMINIGLIPPHPASIIKKSVYNKYGLYKNLYTIAGDFEFFVRLLKIHNLKYKKYNSTIIRMKTGGASGRNFISYLITLKENFHALKINKQMTSIILLFFKIPSKIKQLFFFNQEKLNEDFKIFKKYYKYENQPTSIKIITNIKKIFNKNFVYSGLNLAFLAYYFNKNIKIYKDLYNWPDGISVKILNESNLNKIPGRQILNNMQIPDYINFIRVIGVLSKNSFIYLQNKFDKKIIHNNLPFGTATKLLKFLPKKLSKNELIILTLPTPKQEIIAEYIAKHHSNFKIICAGAAVAMLSGDEKIVPKFLEVLGLEFLWRLKSDTKRRIKRLFQTLIYFNRGYFNKKIENIKIKTL
jgi:glycosyltransferase involved in cell wall biosynthesis